MRWFNRTRLRLRTFWRRRQLDRDLEEELGFHLEMLSRDHGDARRRFGNAAALKESCRELWTLGPVEILWQDLRYAFRTLRKNRAFTGVAVLTLALGIGANSAIFSVVNGVMLQALPYPDSARLAMLWTTIPRNNTDESTTSVPTYLDWRSQSRAFQDIAYYSSEGATVIDRNGVLDAENVVLGDVSPNFFTTLAVQPMLGRVFTQQEAAGAEPDIVLSHQL